MSLRSPRNIKLVGQRISPDDRGPDEVSGFTLSAHPLAHQELPYQPEYAVYAGRVVSARMGVDSHPDDMYWQLRRRVVVRHTAELPTEIRGPDAVRLADRVFTRSVDRVGVGRASYQIACYFDGGMITDGLLLRLEEERFWYVQADGDLFSWLKAHTTGLDVDVFDPGVFVTQVQGPRSLDVLESVVDGGLPDRFRYFDVARVQIAGQPVVVSRTGFTNELGWEIYLGPDIDAGTVGEAILAAGRPFGIRPVSADGFRTRRIEAGIINAGSDCDYTTTPFAVGLGHLVELDKGEFAGRAALEGADRRRRTWGLRVEGGVARPGRTLTHDGEEAGLVTSTGWSPFQECGVAIVRLHDPELGPGTQFMVECRDGEHRRAVTTDTPMYDEERRIPRGEVVEIP